MPSKLVAGAVVLALAAVTAACGDGEDRPGGVVTETDTGTVSGTGTGSGTHSGTETGTGAESETGTEGEPTSTTAE